MKQLFLSLILFVLVFPLWGQGGLWTDADRKYTLDNMKRTRDELIKETENLTPAQWAFHESPERWSIGEIVEHLAIWEGIWTREMSIGLSNKPMPELNAVGKPDSFHQGFIMEETPHVSPDYTRPTGHIAGRKNLDYFLRNHAINLTFAETTKADLRAYFERTNTPNPRSMHQVLILQWGHVDRHLRQIKKVKTHPNYPNP